jgi:hypothetical protein
VGAQHRMAGEREIPKGVSRQRWGSPSSFSHLLHYPPKMPISPFRQRWWQVSRSTQPIYYFFFYSGTVPSLYSGQRAHLLHFRHMIYVAVCKQRQGLFSFFSDPDSSPSCSMANVTQIILLYYLPRRRFILLVTAKGQFSHFSC